MRFLTFNVNGLRAIMGKEGFPGSILDLQPDVIALEETKLSDPSFPLNLEGYTAYHTESKVRKGYSGVAVLTNKEPLSVRYGLLDGKYDDEGRAVTLEFDGYYFVGLYVPNSGEGLKRLDFRLQFQKDLIEYINTLQAVKPVIVTGDMNVAPEEIDLKNPSRMHHQAGFTDEEREAHRELLKETHTFEAFRTLYPEKIEYSWWSYRFHARENNAGWRIDHFILSDSLRPLVKDCTIHTSIMGSDHCPVSLDLAD